MQTYAGVFLTSTTLQENSVTERNYRDSREIEGVNTQQFQFKLQTGQLLEARSLGPSRNLSVVLCHVTCVPCGNNFAADMDKVK